MADKFSPQKRSEIMSRIGGKNTAPEVRVRRLLHRMGYRFRLHVKKLPGKPDIVLPRFKTAVFVHGCFWHGHEGCKRATVPATRKEFWIQKIEANRARDAKVAAALEEVGYRPLVIWQCELKDESAVESKLRRRLHRGAS